MKTIGDCYMGVAGCLGIEPEHRSLLRATMFAHHSIEILERLREEIFANGSTPSHASLTTASVSTNTNSASIASTLGTGDRNTESIGLHMRFGLCAGPVSAGVIGTSRLQYDLWGDTGRSCPSYTS